MILGLFFTSGISNAFNLQSSKLNFDDVIGEGVTIGSFGTELEFHKTGKDNGQWRLLVGAPTSGNGTVYNCDPIAGDCNELGSDCPQFPCPLSPGDRTWTRLHNSHLSSTVA